MKQPPLFAYNAGTMMKNCPIAIETIFAVLVHRAWTGNLSALIRMHARGEGQVVLVMAAPGTALSLVKYAGRTMIRPESSATERYRRKFTSSTGLVGALRAAGLPGPDRKLTAG